MKNIPVFATEFGAASLILKEIPYTAEAYVKIQDTQDPEKLIAECCSFCKMAGAQRVYATGHPYLEKYPIHTAVWRMTVARSALADTDASLFPVTEHTLEQWRSLYNQRMADVPNAAYITVSDAKEMLSRGDGYFVHKDGELLGIGRASGERIDAVIAAKPGAGKEVVLALSHALSGEQAVLEVASANHRALTLYTRLGFLKTAETVCWYKV